MHVDHSIEGSDKRLGTYKPPSTIHELTECFVNFNTICGVYYGSILSYFNSLGFAQLIKLNYEDDEKYDLRELCDFVDSQWQHWCVQLDRLTREPSRFQFSFSELQQAAEFHFMAVPLMLCDEHDEHFYRNLILSVQREERDVLRAQVARSRAAARTLARSEDRKDWI